AERLDRQFQRAILGLTALAVAGLLGGTTVGRYAVASLAARARLAVSKSYGLEPDHAEVEALLRLRRTQTVDKVRESLTSYYRGAEPGMQDMFRVTGMDPEHCLIGWGRATNALL